VIFIGATTENPSFELNNALLSRSRIYKLKSIEPAQLVHLMRRALNDQIHGLGSRKLNVSDETLRKLALAADGDGRKALNLLEISSDLAQENVIDDHVISEVLSSDFRRFDKGGDLFFEQISALHKAVRGSSPDAALYWLSRMLDGGCDPLYVARRVVRMASEDIGNADPRALQLCLNAWQVQERLGSPEGELAIAQAVIYLAVAAKSNAVYSAFSESQKDASTQPSYDVPMHIRNAPTQMMKDMGYGEDYNYAHNFDDAFVPGENYFPEALHERRYYEPVNRGMEIQISEKLKMLRDMDSQSDFQRYKNKE
jgi:putative ATPase